MQQPPHTIIDVDAEMPTLGDGPSADVDAFTAAPLHERRHIAVTLSATDGKQLRLWYNTKTLIIIAQRKGRWMQPPHFRTDMDDAMVREIERIENRRIDVETPLTRFGWVVEATNDAGTAAGPDAEGRPSTRHVDVGNCDAVATALHAGDVLDSTALRAVAAMNHFVGARAHEPVYVCPVCYTNALKRLQARHEALVEDEWLSVVDVLADDRSLDDAQRELIMDRFLVYARRSCSPPCPMEVIESLDPEARVEVCFARAAAWLKHLCRSHGTKCFDSQYWAVEQLVKERLAEADSTERFVDGAKRYTTNRYWAMDAKWRTLVYNELRRSTAAVSGPSVRSSGETSPCPEPPEGDCDLTTPAASQPRKQHRAEVAEDDSFEELDSTDAEPTDDEDDSDEVLDATSVVDPVEENDAASGCDSDDFMSACSFDAYAETDGDELSLPHLSADPWMRYDYLTSSQENTEARSSNQSPLVVCH